METTTTDKAQDTLDEARDLASDVVEAAAKPARNGAKRAAKAVEAVAEPVEERAAEPVTWFEDRRDADAGDFTTRRPLRLFLLAGLAAAVIAVLFIRRGAGSVGEGEA